MSLSNPPKSPDTPDQVDALDAIEAILIEYSDRHSTVWSDEQEYLAQAKAKLSALLVEAQIKAIYKLRDAMEDDERPNADWYREPFQCVHDLMDKVIKELEKQREA